MWGFYQSADAACLESSTANEESTASIAATEGPESAVAKPELKKDWRFYSGTAVVVLAGVLPVFSLGVPLLGLPTAWAVTLVAGLIGGGPEVLLLVAAALLGKDTMHYFLGAAKNWCLRILAPRPAASQA